jgi:putative phosphonate metabolism protein
MTAPRYAVYYAPAAGSPWWRFGASWVGRDEILDAPLSQPTLAGIALEELRQFTAEPRRYGFHATLKAPFRLHERVTQEQLLQRVDALAARLQPVPLGELVPACVDDFVALVPAAQNGALDAVAACCVTDLDDLRAPLTPAETARRQPERLDETGRRLLARYGYPHVLGRFKFHLTLSGPVDAASAARILRAAEPRVRALDQAAAPRLDRLCVFREAAPGAAFVRIHDAEIGA